MLGVVTLVSLCANARRRLELSMRARLLTTVSMRCAVLRGLLLTLTGIAVVELLPSTVLRGPIPTALLVVVAYVAYAGGLLSGLISAVTTSLYALYYLSIPGELFRYTDENFTRLMILPLASLVLALIVGSLRRSLHASEQQLRRQLTFSKAIEDNLGEGVYALDTEGRVTFMNPAAERVLGWTQAELMGKVMHDFIHFQHADGRPYPRRECPGLQVLREARTYRTDDDVFTAKDGTIVPVAYSSSPILVDGQVKGAVVAFRDVTERKRYERRLTTQYAVSRVLAESTTLREAVPEVLATVGECLEWDYGGLWVVDRKDDVLRCLDTWHAPTAVFRDFDTLNRNITFARGVGLPGRVWADGAPVWITDASADPNFPRLLVAVLEGLRGGFGLPILIGRNVIGVCEFFSRGVRPRDPELLEMMAALGGQIGQFIERKRAEEGVRESEARKAAMLQSALDAIVTIDQDGKVMEFNPAAERIFGYGRAEVIGREMAELIVPPPLRDKHRQGLALYLSTGQSSVLNRRIEMTAARADGTEFPAEFAITRIRFDGPPMFTGYIRDITDRKRAEESLAARARQQAAVTHLGQRALLIPEVPALVEEAVALAQRTLALEHCQFMELGTEPDRIPFEAGAAQKEGHEVYATGTARHPLAADGTRLPDATIANATPYADIPFGESQEHETSTVSGASIVIHNRDRPFGVLVARAKAPNTLDNNDIYFLQAIADVLAMAIERKAFEEQLARERAEAERLGELDRLRAEFISSVSHELRTPLTAARLGVGMVETSTSDRLRTDERQLLGNARRNIERLGLLIDDLLAYNQLQAGAMRLDCEPLDLRTVVGDAVPVVHPLLDRKSQSLEVDLREPLRTEGDARRLEQVIVNLLANAHKHTPAGTRITISGRIQAGEVILKVSDNGRGIAPEECEAIFGRFYRGGSDAGGSGLGLAIARGIADLHGGRLWVESRPGTGATFCLALPKKLSPEEERSADTSSRGSYGVPATSLIEADSS